MSDLIDKSPEAFASLLGISNFLDEDWDLIHADADRVADFCEIYEREALTPNDKKSLMQLIVASYDDHLEGVSPSESFENRIYKLLKQDFELHRDTIEYWSALKSWGGYGWKVSPLMQKILLERSTDAQSLIP